MIIALFSYLGLDVLQLFLLALLDTPSASDAWAQHTSDSKNQFRWQAFGKWQFNPTKSSTWRPGADHI